MTPRTSSIRSLWMLLRITVCILLLLLPVVASEARAQSSDTGSASDDVWAGVEEMVVSGSTAGGILADVARSNSVTAFDSKDLEAIGAADISDLANFTPNLEIVTAGSTSPTFFIRGIGLNDFNANAAGSVAVYQDEVPLNSPALQLGSLFDVENAAILRGPQGTGPFRNASAGAIKVYSKKPTGDFGVTFRAELGNYDAQDFEGSLQFPITDETLWARIAFRSTTREGTFKNRCSGAPPIEDRVPRPGGIPRPGDDPTLWAHCNEQVNIGKVSDVDVNMPKNMNSRDNWALRGMFLFQPDLRRDVDMDWLITVRGSRRDEPSFVGQSIGTTGNQQFLDPVTGDERHPSITGILGGIDQGGYRDPDVIRQQTETEAAFLLKFGCVPADINCIKASRTAAERSVASDLGREMDSNPQKGNINHAGGTTNDTYGGSLKGSIEFGDMFELTTVTGYDGWQRRVDVDLDFTPNRSFETDTEDDGWQVFQEIRINGQAFDGLSEIFGGPLDWEVGGFVLYESLDAQVDLDFGGNATLTGAVTRRSYSQEVTSFAGYASFSWDFWEAFTLDGGIRYNREKREIDEFELFIGDPPRGLPSSLVKPTDEEIIGEEPTGTVRLTYRPTEESSFYIKYTHGWKSGTFNATGSQRLGVTSASPEKIDAFEAGLRGSYFDNRFNLSGAMFHYTYNDYQLFTSLSSFQTPPQFVVENAHEVELYGAEVEATILPWDGGLIDFKFAWLEGEFVDFVRTQIVTGFVAPGVPPAPLVTELDQSGNRLLNAPRFTISLTLQQAFPIGRFGTIIPRWDGAWKAKTYYDSTEGRGLPNRPPDQQIFLPKNTIGQQALWIHNVRLAYLTPDESIEVAGWVRNVSNETYKSFAADLTTFQRTTLYFVGDPRTFGVTTSVRF
jgi:outer membrane receptor protein involved in Fe transport